jgi:metal-responsive CopG/Arc/MetJ family transcriptional regulator
MHMRMHIELDDELIAQVDALSGPRGRSAFVRTAVERAVQQERRWSALESAGGVIADHGHDWDDDPAAWVRGQRRPDPRRAG